MNSIKNFLNPAGVSNEHKIPLPYEVPVAGSPRIFTLNTACFNEIFDYSSFINAISIARVESLLQIFGHLIDSIQWNKTDRAYDIEVMNIIAKYCGQTLSELIIRDNNVNMRTEIT